MRHPAEPLTRQFHLHCASLKPADVLVKDGRRSQWVVQSDLVPLLKPDLGEIQDRPQQAEMEPFSNLARVQLDLTGHVQAD